MGRQLKSILRSLLPRHVRPQRILGGPLRGHRIVTSWHDYPAAILGRTERPLLDWFAQTVQPGETWIDVGAHYGYTAIALSQLVGPSGRVLAFEPMLSTAGYLAQTRLLNGFCQLVVLPLALAAPRALELRQLPTTRGMVDSTLGHRPPTAAHRTLRAAGGPRTVDSRLSTEWLETILVASLDWLWPQVCAERPRIDGIKVDVQGMETDALRGMSGLLSEWRPRLVIEFHAGVDRPELLDLIAEAGYCCQATPIEPMAGETEPAYVDDRSYAFQPAAPLPPARVAACPGSPIGALECGGHLRHAARSSIAVV